LNGVAHAAMKNKKSAQQEKEIMHRLLADDRHFMRVDAVILVNMATAGSIVSALSSAELVQGQS